MGFQAIEKGKIPALERASESVRVSQTNNTLMLSIPVALLQQIGKPEYVTVALGTGNDKGWIAVYRGTKQNGYKCNYKGNNAVSFTIYASRFGTQGLRIARQDIAHTATATTVYVDIAPAIASGATTSSAMKKSAHVNAARIAAE